MSVDWGVLTNGKDFEILSVTGDDSQNGETSIATFDLDEMAKNPDILEILTKDAIQSGRADDIARQPTQTSRAIRRLSDREESIAGRLAEVLRDELGEIPLDFEEQSLDYVHDLQHALHERREFIGKSTTDDDDTSSDDISEDDPDTGEVNIEPVDNNVAGTIRRTDIEGDQEAQVAVFPTRESGLTFILENNAWGFVRVGRDFDYVAMYVTQNAREVQYVAKVRDIVVPEDAELTREPTEYVDRSKIADNKMVVRFEPGGLYELEDPIHYEIKYPQSLRYTTLGEFRTAETTDDIF